MRLIPNRNEVRDQRLAPNLLWHTGSNNSMLLSIGLQTITWRKDSSHEAYIKPANPSLQPLASKYKGNYIPEAPP